MVKEKSWEEFRESGLLWWINTLLHTFGWAIIYDYDDDKNMTVYPARVKFRGFSEKSNSNGYYKISKFINENSEDLLKESEK